MSGRDDPWLAIILAVVDAVEGNAAEHFSRISEVQASLFQSAVALLRIESDLHPTICVPPEMSPVKLPWPGGRRRWRRVRRGVARSAGCARIPRAAKAHGVGGRPAHPQLCASRKRHKVSASARKTAHSQSDCQFAKLSSNKM